MEIGRVIGTERKPNTAYTFSFWSPIETPIGIGTLVKVVTGTAVVYGTVTEAHGFNDLESPLHEFLAVGGEAGTLPPTERPEMRVYQAAVLRREPEEPISAVPIGPVYLATEADVQRALRTDEYAEQFGIPAGCYGSKADPIAVHLHASFLIGPEAGHLNMTGTSGLAAKTSYILFLLQAIFQRQKGTAALLFNTKGGDLLYIDREPTEGFLESSDLRLYEACGLQAKPFERVRYYAPRTKTGAQLNTVRCNEILEASNPTRPFSFGLSDVIKHADVLLSQDDLDAKADAYLQYLNDEFVLGEGRHIGDQHYSKVNNLQELCDVVKRQLDHGQTQAGSSVDGHHIHTIRKMYNRLSNFGRRYMGLIAEKGTPQGPFDEPFEPGTVYVVDVAGLGSDEQDLVFAAYITSLREKMENGELGVQNLVVMVDELNKYAPSGGRDTYVARSLKEIAARGRYLGLTLFGAQQFRSRVDKEIVGNAATHAFGHIETEELAQPGYGYFSPAIKEKLGALSPGEILIKHPHFAQPIFLRFPRPACLKGSDGMRIYAKEKNISARDAIVREFSRLGGSRNANLDAVSDLSQEDRSLLDVLHQLQRLQDGTDPMPVLRNGKKSPPAPKEPKVVVGEFDPFESSF